MLLPVDLSSHSTNSGSELILSILFHLIFTLRDFFYKKLKLVQGCSIHEAWRQSCILLLATSAASSAVSSWLLVASKVVLMGADFSSSCLGPSKLNAMVPWTMQHVSLR